MEIRRHQTDDQDVMDLNSEIIEALAHAFGMFNEIAVHESSEDGSPIIRLRNGRTFKIRLWEQL